MPEQSLSDVHADIVARFEHDKRIRHLEVESATTVAALAEMKQALPRMEERLVKTIEGNKPKSPLPVVMAIIAGASLLLTLAAAIYGQQ